MSEGLPEPEIGPYPEPDEDPGGPPPLYTAPVALPDPPRVDQYPMSPEVGGDG